MIHVGPDIPARTIPEECVNVCNDKYPISRPHHIIPAEFIGVETKMWHWPGGYNAEAQVASFQLANNTMGWNLGEISVLTVIDLDGAEDKLGLEVVRPGGHIDPNCLAMSLESLSAFMEAWMQYRASVSPP